jgi:hypothetical protein
MKAAESRRCSTKLCAILSASIARVALKRSYKIRQNKNQAKKLWAITLVWMMARKLAAGLARPPSS